MADGWGKATSDTATAAGARAVAKLVEHGITFDAAHGGDAIVWELIARACALAVDEAIDALDAENAKLRRWRDALIDAAVVGWTYTADQEDDPHALINALLCQVQREALDPAISKEARDLIERGRADERAGTPPAADLFRDDT